MYSYSRPILTAEQVCVSPCCLFGCWRVATGHNHPSCLRTMMIRSAFGGSWWWCCSSSSITVSVHATTYIVPRSCRPAICRGSGSMSRPIRCRFFTKRGWPGYASPCSFLPFSILRKFCCTSIVVADGRGLYDLRVVSDCFFFILGVPWITACPRPMPKGPLVDCFILY
jgi:hypothetical protein